MERPPPKGLYHPGIIVTTYILNRRRIRPVKKRMPPYKTFSFMSGFLGCISRDECVNEVFYGTDYHSHLGTKRAGMAFVAKGKFMRSIHSLEDGYFRNKFESELPKFASASSPTARPNQ